MRAEESSSKPKKVMQEVGPSLLDSSRGTHNSLHATFFFFFFFFFSGSDCIEGNLGGPQ